MEKLQILQEILELLKNHLPHYEANLHKEKFLRDDLIKREAARLILAVSHKTFSRHIDGRLLHPICLLGKRKMYSKKEVYALIDRKGGMNFRSMS